MSDSRRAPLFGVGQPNAPRIVLLDEVHTYEGSHGAQVAYLLRRWRWAVRKKVQFTGLSATLENARDFFAQLTGLRPSSVVPVAGDDMEPKGVEYQLALRGDPFLRLLYFLRPFRPQCFCAEYWTQRKSVVTRRASGNEHTFC